MGVKSSSANRRPFVGRQLELEQLRRTARLPKASLIVCRGRRRIGKSALIEQFGTEFDHFYEFQGLAPHENAENHNQLDIFSRQLAEQLSLAPLKLTSWYEALVLLARLIQGQRALLFLDEISWMASQDKTFAGQLKIVWDTHFKKNPKLVLVLCGSVSSWIDKNILNSTDFVGRISLTLDLPELPLDKCNEFFREVGGAAGRRMSAAEKLRILSVTGGVPRYLEEIDYRTTAERNVVDLCFRKGGLLVVEFDKIFSDIFTSHAPICRDIVCELVGGPRTFMEICERLGVDPNGVITQYLQELELSGFIQRDYVYSLGSGQRGKLSRYRLKDNYLRFYLRYIEPAREKIAAGIQEAQSFSAFDAIMGLQFQNLVLNNLPRVLEKLKIPLAAVKSASPYFQNKTQRQEACQVDLLIDTQYAVYVCEIKFQSHLSVSIIDEVMEKMRKLKIAKGKSIRPVLIYSGELPQSIGESGSFDELVSFERFLE